MKTNVLSRDAMKSIRGGSAWFDCNYTDGAGHVHQIQIDADNINQAQAWGDSYAYSDRYTQLYPNGIDCPGAE
jgi:hypothetical protein